MATTVADTLLDQRLDALALANETRIGMVEVRREVKAGRPFEEALVDPRAQAMKIAALVRAQRRWGPERTASLLRDLRIGEQRKVGKLTDRQRRRLLYAMSLSTEQRRRWVIREHASLRDAA